MPKSSTELGMAVWCIQDTQTGEYCTGVVQTSGAKREVNPYRSELQGIHMVLMAVYVICNFHQVTSGKVTVCCDNKKALWLSGQWLIQVSLTQKHVDLIQAIHKLAAVIPIEIVFEDITGHIDDIHHLVSNILMLVHKQWIAQNAVVHTCNKLGLKVCEGEELKIAIDTQFCLGIDDCQYLTITSSHEDGWQLTG